MAALKLGPEIKIFRRLREVFRLRLVLARSLDHVCCMRFADCITAATAIEVKMMEVISGPHRLSRVCVSHGKSQARGNAHAESLDRA